MSGLSTDAGNDEAVRRLREESARRLAREARWRAFAAWCAVATIAGGISLAAVDARQARSQADEAEAERAAVARAQANACHRLFEKLAAIDKEFHEQLARARSEEERVRLRTAVLEARVAATRGAPTGCGGASPSAAVPYAKPHGCVLHGTADPLDGM
jgi:hypothetical protein